MKHLAVSALLTVVLMSLAASCGREAPVGTLSLTADIENASIAVTPVSGGDTFVRTAPAALKLPIGRYDVVLNYDPQEYVVGQPVREARVDPAQNTLVHFGAVQRLGSLAIASTPAGAAVLVDGEGTDEITPVTLLLPEGEHLVDLALDGYVTDSGPQTFDVVWNAPLAAAFTLLPSGFVAVTSDPAGAAVLVDGVNSDENTPVTLEIAAGDHVIRVARPGFLVSPDSLAITVPEGGEVDAAFVLAAEGTLGDLSVTSVPTGAAILIDDENTGEVTPHVFALPPLPHQVSVRREGFQDAVARTVTPAAGTQTDEAFVLTARKRVLLETMSGVNCPGCPAMNILLKTLVETGGYHSDRVLGMKISGPFGGDDLHYDANRDDLQARMHVYNAGTGWDYAAPTLFLDGDLPVAPAMLNGYPAYGDMVLLLESALAADPGFAIEVAVADWEADPLQVTVDLIPTREVADPDAVLMLAVVENPVIYDEAPGSTGETLFHWVTREIEQAAAAPLPVSPAAPGHFEVSVPKDANWTDVNRDALWLIAFVQNTTTLEVLQAGALAPAAAASSPRPAR